MKVYTGDYRPDLGKDRLSVRIAKYLLANWSSPEEHEDVEASFCHDMFGVLEPEEKLFDFPELDKTNLIDASLERAREIGPCTIAWSGGIDSSFVLACFVYNNIPVKTITFLHPGCHIRQNVFDYVKNRFGNYAIDPSRIIENGYYDEPKIQITKRNDIEIVTGSWSDALFFPNQRLKGEMKWTFDSNYKRIVTYSSKPFIGLSQLMRNAKDKDKRVFSEDEISRVIEYSKKFRYPLKTNIDIARFLSFISIMPVYLYDNPLRYSPKMIPFFRTQKFINIAYSQFWYANRDMNYPKDKKILLEFIHEVFGKKFVVTTNW